MGRLVKGDVVVVPFPFSDLSGTKRRPALVVASAGGSDFILCQITSRTVRDGHAILVSGTDFTEAGLRAASNIRPNHLFTADQRVALYRAGRLTDSTVERVVKRIKEMLDAPT